MSGPKIRVGTDFDTKAVEQGLKNIRKLSDEVNKSLNSGSVGIDVKQAKNQLSALEKNAESLAAALKKAGTADMSKVVEAMDEASAAASALEQVLDAVGQATGMDKAVKHSRDTAEHLNRANRGMRELNREGVKFKDNADVISRRWHDLANSKMRGTAHLKGMDFDDWASDKWKNYSLNRKESERNRQRILEHIGGMGGPAADRGSWKERASKMARLSGRFGGALGGAAAGMVSGGGFGIGALSGAAVGMIPGAGMILGPLAGALGGILDKALDRALSEASDLTDLRKSLGATAVDFDQLRGNIRHFSDGLGVGYNEAAKLAKTFGHTANAVGDNVGQGTGNAIGFARGYGMDPQAAVMFFATMRHYGVSRNEGENKRLAVNIAEAINRGGVSPKADEAMAAISNFVQASSRQSLTESNAYAYASFLSSMTGLGMYGMKGDPMAAAGAMGKVDAAMRHGGAFGEASKNFSLGIYQRALPGFSAFDMDYLNEQGAFGSVARAFGRESPAYQMAMARGDKRKMRQYDKWASMGGDQSMLSLQMQGLERFYGGNTEGFTKAMMSHFGLGAGESAALYNAFQSDKGLGGLEAAMKAAGVDMGKLSTKQIATMAELSTGDSKVLRGHAQRLMGLSGDDALNEGEKKTLEAALANGDPEEIRKVVMKLSEVHDATKDEGEKMRQIQSDMQNSLQRMATNLIPLTISMNGSLLALVKGLVPESEEARNIAADEEMAASLDAGIAYNKKKIAAFDQAHKNHEELRQKTREAREDYRRLRDAGAPADQVTRALHKWKGLRSKFNASEIDMATEFSSKKGLMEDTNRLIDRRNQVGSVGPTAETPYDLQTGRQLPASSAYADVRAAGASGSGRSGKVSGNAAEWRAKILAEARRQGLTPEEQAAVLALAQHESQFNPNAVGSLIKKGMHRGDRARGLFQYMRLSSLGWNRLDPMQNIRHGVADFKRRARQYGIRGAINAHHSGEKNLNRDGSLKQNTSDGHQTTSEYEKTIQGYIPGNRAYVNGSPQADARIPRDRLTAGSQLAATDIRLDNRVIILDRDGNEMGNTVTQSQTRIGAPVPAGVSFG